MSRYHSAYQPYSHTYVGGGHYSHVYSNPVLGIEIDHAVNYGNGSYGETHHFNNYHYGIGYGEFQSYNAEYGVSYHSTVNSAPNYSLQSSYLSNSYTGIQQYSVKFTDGGYYARDITNVSYYGTSVSLYHVYSTGSGPGTYAYIYTNSFGYDNGAYSTLGPHTQYLAH